MVAVRPAAPLTALQSRPGRAAESVIRLRSGTGAGPASAPTFPY